MTIGILALCVFAGVIISRPIILAIRSKKKVPSIRAKKASK